MQTGPFSEYTSAIAAAPSDTAAVTCRAIYVGGAGNVAVKLGPVGAPGAAVTFTAVPVGTILPIGIDGGQLMATNTTATLLILLS